MKYEKIVQAKFIERENRFVATVELAGSEGRGNNRNKRNNCNKCDKTVNVHVKNTGRCRELLVPGSTVYLEDFDGRMGNRKMRYSLVAVEKAVSRCAGVDETLLVNMDSQAPNKVVQEALEDGRIRLPGLNDSDDDRFTLIKPETRYGDSRFDFYVEAVSEAGEAVSEAGEAVSKAGEADGAPKRAFIEVKGVTLEDNGHARFPEAPTERGVKHINELIRARREGYLAYILFMVQMEGMKEVSPNYETHPEFGEALAKAAEAGVEILAYDCKATPDTLTINKQIEFCL